MNEQMLLTTLIYPEAPVDTISNFRQEYLGNQLLFRMQPPLIQRFLEAQAITLGEAIVNEYIQLQFTLPDHVLIHTKKEGPQNSLVPAELREQTVGYRVGRLMRANPRAALGSRLLELEHSTNLAISASAILLRYALVMHLVHNMLPSGRNITYVVAEGDEIPSIPIRDPLMSKSAFTDLSDAKTVEDAPGKALRGDLSVPYVEAARRFFLPQWVAFDLDGNLLVTSEVEAEAQIGSMQNYLSVLHAAVDLAPYMVADEDYQNKRYGILGQLVYQGRALAHFQVKQIIHTIQRRAAVHDLDRGLSISLPYFNDQTLHIEESRFDVIPSGRVMFIPAFVVLAVRAQAAKIVQDTRLSLSTRRQILMELGTLEQTFLR